MSDPLWTISASMVEPWAKIKPLGSWEIPEIIDPCATPPNFANDLVEYRARWQYGLPIVQPSMVITGICTDFGPIKKPRKRWRPRVTRQQRRARRWFLRHACCERERAWRSR